jgi:hypothetical protein
MFEKQQLLHQKWDVGCLHPFAFVLSLKYFTTFASLESYCI